MSEIHWKAVLDNGDEVLDIDSLGNPITTDSLDRDRLSLFILYDEDATIISLDLSENRRLVFRKRTVVASTGIASSVYLVGWSYGDNEIQLFVYNQADGSLTANPPAVKVELLDFEKQR